MAMACQLIADEVTGGETLHVPHIRKSDHQQHALDRHGPTDLQDREHRQPVCGQSC